MTARVISLQQLAVARDARLEGAYAIGSRRVLVEQTVVLCGDKHRRPWRRADVGGPVVCGVCHPPPMALEVVWV